MEMPARHRKPHCNLDAWRQTMDLVLEIYQITEAFQSVEAYGLAGQLRRAAGSVPSNIAEGAAGRTWPQFQNYLSSALGSLNEIDTQLELALRLKYISRQDYSRINQRLDDCLAVTYGLRKSLRTKPT